MFSYDTPEGICLAMTPRGCIFSCDTLGEYLHMRYLLQTLCLCLNAVSQTLDPKPSKPKPQSLNPKHETLLLPIAEGSFVIKTTASVPKP